MTSALLALILSLPRAVYAKGEDPETDLEYRARMAIVAEATAQAASRAVCASGREGCERIWPGSKEDLATMLVVMGWYESKFLLRVHQGKCLPNECDALKLSGGGGVIHRARSLWQVQSSRMVPPTEWKKLDGADLEATTRAAVAAAKILSASRARCVGASGGGWEKPTISAYATGSRCSWSGAMGRARVYRRSREKLAFYLAEESRERSGQQDSGERVWIDQSMEASMVLAILSDAPTSSIGIEIRSMIW